MVYVTNFFRYFLCTFFVLLSSFYILSSGDNFSINKKRSSNKYSRDEIEKVVESVLREKIQDLPDKKNYRVGSLSREMRSILSSQYNYPELTEKKISLSLKDLDVRDAIELIGKSLGFNFLVDPDVRGKIRFLRFDNVPISIVLRNILQSNFPKLALIKDCGLFRVSRLASAKDLLLERGENNFDFAVVPLMFLNWDRVQKKKIERVWRSIIGNNVGKTGFYLIIDENSKKIFCRGRSYHIFQFRRFLKEMDWQVPQVKIEARFVCAEKGFEENIGFQWSGIYNRRSSASKGFNFIGAGRPLSAIHSGSSGSSGSSGVKESLVDWALNFLPTPKRVSKVIGLPFVFGGRDLNTARLNMVLNVAEGRNEIKTILRPTVLTNDGESSEILVGENVPIEKVTEEIVDGRVRNIRTAEYRDIGMQLKVRPVVSPDRRYVHLDIYIENSHKSDSVRSGRTSYPVIRTTRSRSKIRLRSGQTTMISGLIKDIKEVFKTKAPILGDIPIIGWFFRGSRRAKRDMQLLIFITPTVI